VDGLDDIVQVLELGRADNRSSDARLGQGPRGGDLAHAHASLFRDFFHSVHNLLIRLGAAIGLLKRVHLRTLGLLTAKAAKKTSGERGPWDRSDVERTEHTLSVGNISRASSR